MFPNFTSLSQRERKRQELLRDAQLELRIDRHLQDRYTETTWAADYEASLIKLPTSSTVVSTQTDATTPAATSVFSTPEVKVSPPDVKVSPPDVEMSPPDVEMVPSKLEEDLPAAQYMSMKLITSLFNKFPDLLTNAIKPIFIQPSTRRSTTFFLGKNAQIYRSNDRKPVPDALATQLEREIDWVATENYVRSRLESMGILRQVISEIPLSKDRAEQMDDQSRTASLRNTFNALAENRGLIDTEPAEALIDSQNEKWYKSALMQILSTNRPVVNKLNLPPFGKDGSVLDESYKLDKLSLALRHSGVELRRSEANKIISWQQTLREFLKQSASKRYQLDIPAGLNIRYYGADRKHRLDDSTISNTPTTSKRKVSPEDYRKMVEAIFQINPYLTDKDMPSYSPTGIDRIENDYVFAKNGNLVMRSTGRALSKKQSEKASRAIAWEPTYQYVIGLLIDHKHHIEDSPTINAEGKLMLTGINKTLDSLGVKVSRRVVKNAPNDPPMQLDDLEEKAPAPVSGRGLMGAGYAPKNLKDKDGNPIKYHSFRGYNLAQLEGTGVASSMAYKRLGTKFVHLPKLNDGLLKIVYPSRSNVGSIRKISKEMTDLLKTLIFDGVINQQLFDTLSVGEKRLFHELLRITHTQHTLRDPVEDPREVLKQEYTKLKGELMLGNDNPAMIKELKKVLIDMYQAKLISDDEFKQVLLAIV